MSNQTGLFFGVGCQPLADQAEYASESICQQFMVDGVTIVLCLGVACLSMSLILCILVEGEKRLARIKSAVEGRYEVAQV
jgi:hypothetical protein